MRNRNTITLLSAIGLLITWTASHAQQSLWFGTVKIEDKISQGRFEVFGDSTITSIVYAPYGITPTTFEEVTQKKDKLTFIWQVDHVPFHCLLLNSGSSGYIGSCSSDRKQPIQLIIRQFTNEDAILQGDSLHASLKDIQILDRALTLLNNGSNWNRIDNRVCDQSLYPYKWSLFCALHQASIDVDLEYRHLRPATQAVRQAINEITQEKKYAHLLQDYNNEAKSFDSIIEALNRAKKIISEQAR
jgi:hypothetical protein